MISLLDNVFFLFFFSNIILHNYLNNYILSYDVVATTSHKDQ